MCVFFEEAAPAIASKTHALASHKGLVQTLQSADDATITIEMLQSLQALCDDMSELYVVVPSRAASKALGHIADPAQELITSRVRGMLATESNNEMLQAAQKLLSSAAAAFPCNVVYMELMNTCASHIASAGAANKVEKLREAVADLATIEGFKDGRAALDPLSRGLSAVVFLIPASGLALAKHAHRQELDKSLHLVISSLASADMDAEAWLSVATNLGPMSLLSSGSEDWTRL